MQNQGQYKKGSRSLGAMVKEFFAWLKGYGTPRYVPQKVRTHDGGRKKTLRKSD